jgi:hypothetical protein
MFGNGDELMAEIDFKLIAKGEPAPLRQRDVDRLAQGESDTQLISALASQPVYESLRPTRAAKSSFAPIAVDADELAAMSAGRIDGARKFEEALEMVSQEPARFGTAKDVYGTKARPLEEVSNC